MNTLADVVVGGNGIGQAMIFLVVAVIACAFFYWVITSYVPAPLQRWAILVLVLIGVIFIINFVLSLGGNGFIHWH